MASGFSRQDIACEEKGSPYGKPAGGTDLVTISAVRVSGQRPVVMD